VAVQIICETLGPIRIFLCGDIIENKEIKTAKITILVWNSQLFYCLRQWFPTGGPRHTRGAANF